MTRSAALACLALTCALTSGAALAEDVAAAPAGRAEQLFQDGKQRLAQNDYAAACPLLAESYALDPASGTLLALAVCHERAGKLASAYKTYREVETRSRGEQRGDREQAARAQADALVPKLSTLTIASAAKAAALEVKVDGVALDPTHLDAALPIDGGEHAVEASAPNKQPWSTRVSVEPSADAQRVTIPELADLPPPAAPAPAPAGEVVKARRVVGGSLIAPLPPARTPRAAHSRGPSTEQWLGLGTLGVGVVGLGIGTVYAIEAASDDAAPASRCAADGCTYSTSETSDGERAALAFVVGGSLAVTGLVIYLVTAPVSTSARDAAKTERALAGSAWVAPGSAGAALHGRF